MGSNVVRRALAIIDRDMATTTVERICEELNLSHTQLYREFDVYTGETPGTVLRRRRLQRACELLDADDEMTLDAAAVKVGYNSASTLARAFRDLWGISPRTLEAMARNRGRNMASLAPEQED